MLPEGGMARSAAGCGVESRARFKPTISLVDGEHADHVCTKIGREKEFARWVDEDLVRVRGALAIGVGAWLCHRECQVLNGLGIRTERESEGADCRIAAIRNTLACRWPKKKRVVERGMYLLVSNRNVATVSSTAIDGGIDASTDGFDFCGLIQHSFGAIGNT